MPATIRFLCTTALKSSLDELLPLYRDTVDVSYGPTARLIGRLKDGESADAVMLTDQGFDDMATLGKVDAASRLSVARSTAMVAVKKGTPHPDISTVETFREAMLAAKSVAFSRPGTGISGAHMPKVLERLGIAEVMKPKLVLGPGGPEGLIGNYLVRGDAEIGIQQDSELMSVPGVDILGPLPGEIGLITEFVFGIHASANERAAAKALGEFLRTDAARAVMTQKGLTPA